jgi:hypothetical protein
MAASDEPMHGIGDLALALGGSEDSFTGKLLLLIAKADPDNRERLRMGFPRAVRAWETWMASSPALTAAELLIVIDGPMEDGSDLPDWERALLVQEWSDLDTEGDSGDQ